MTNVPVQARAGAGEDPAVQTTVAPGASPAARVRDAHWDALRGVAIVFVVAIHALWLSQPPGRPGPLFVWMVVRHGLRPAVPLFLFIAGYWAARGPEPGWAQVGRRLKRVLVPYLVWSVVLVMSPGAVRTFSSPVALAAALLLGDTHFVYYFVPLICQCYLLTPLLRRVPGGALLVVTGVVQTVYLAALYVEHFRWPVPQVASHVQLYCVAYWFFFALGLQYRQLRDRLSLRVLALLLGVTFVCGVWEEYALVALTKNYDWSLVAVRFGAQCYAVCFTLLLPEALRRLRWRPRWLVMAGRESFGIYLIHVPILMLISRLVKPNPPQADWWRLAWSAGAAATALATCCAVSWLAQRLVSPRLAKEVLGFGV